MTQIYVVMSQGNYLYGSKGEPVAAYPDFPSALTYAQSIFKKVIGSQETPKDLVFLLNISPTIPVPPPAPQATTPATASATK
jgi:hypothetical protein